MKLPDIDLSLVVLAACGILMLFWIISAVN